MEKKPISVCIIINNGMVHDVFADGDVSVEIIDMDSDDYGKYIEAKERYEEVANDPNFKSV